MPFFRKLSFLRSRYFGAVVAGLLLTAAFPKFDLAGMAWFAPGLMAAMAIGKPGWERWRIGYVGGLAHYLSMLYWLLLIPYRWNGLPLGPALGWIALSGFLALFPATWVWMITAPVRQLARRSNQPGAQDRAAQGVEDEPELLPGFSASLPRSWIGRTLWSLFGAAAWVGLEMLLTRIFGGFPWDLLGVSQYRMAPIIHISAITGVYGVSFIIIWISLGLVNAALMVMRRPTARSVWIADLFVPLLAVAILFNQGLHRIRNAPAESRSISVMLIQPSIPQDLIWDPNLDTNRFGALVSYTDQVLTNKSDLVIWPESAVPRMLRYDQETYDAISGLAKKHGVWMIIGCDDAAPRKGAANPKEADYFNSSFLITPQGKVGEWYFKRNLVIFGEYVPLQHWLPFLKWFTPVQGGFTPGTGPVQFHLDNLDVTTSVLICFEDIFPETGRNGVAPETDFLVNITNDGWFGHSAAQWQQAATAVFRTVENGVPLIRCCNNGLTCWIDAQGRIRQILRDEAGTEYGKGFMRVNVPVPRAGEVRQQTYYNRNGDVFGWICFGIACVVLARRIVRAWLARQRPKAA